MYMGNIAGISKKTFFVTKEGLSNLKNEFEGSRKKRIEISRRLRALGSLEEIDHLVMSDLKMMLERIEGEITRIANILQRTKLIVKNENPTTVEVGSTVTLRTASRVMTYILVCPLEVDLTMNKVSQESPLGAVLLGKKLHETVYMVTPKGKECHYEIVGIK